MKLYEILLFIVQVIRELLILQYNLYNLNWELNPGLRKENYKRNKNEIVRRLLEKCPTFIYSSGDERGIDT